MMRPMVRALAIAAAIAGALPAPLLAQALPQKVWTLQSPVVELGYCQQTAVAGAVGLSSGAGKCAAGIPSGSVYAIVTVEGNAARFRDDGTAPTASVGMPLAVGQPWYETGNPLSNFSIIPQTGTMTLNVTFYGVR